MEWMDFGRRMTAGEECMLRGDYRGARQALEPAVALRPDDYSANYMLFMSLAMLDEVSAANVHGCRCNQLQPRLESQLIGPWSAQWTRWGALEPAARQEFCRHMVRMLMDLQMDRRLGGFRLLHFVLLFGSLVLLVLLAGVLMVSQLPPSLASFIDWNGALCISGIVSLVFYVRGSVLHACLWVELRRLRQRCQRLLSWRYLLLVLAVLCLEFLGDAYDLHKGIWSLPGSLTAESDDKVRLAVVMLVAAAGEVILLFVGIFQNLSRRCHKILAYAAACVVMQFLWGMPHIGWARGLNLMVYLLMLLAYDRYRCIEAPLLLRLGCILTAEAILLLPS